MNEQDKLKRQAILDYLRSELDVVGEEIRGAEKTVAKATERLDLAKSNLKDLKHKRNELRLDIKFAKP